jgi:hypothetical protein
MKQDYPEELIEKQIDKYNIYRTFYDAKTYKKDYEDAVKYAKKIKGQVYTLVNGENNHTFYLKGLHWVNRFGFCVLKKDKVKNVKKKEV